jgi:tartrate dehydrogenase/decarboxylase/D-malate dehydrogenase
VSSNSVLAGASKPEPVADSGFVAERKSLYKVAQLGGDGIGPEVIDAGVQVIHAAAKKLGTFSVDFNELDWSSDRYKKTGSYVPDDYIEVLKKHDAIL